MLKHKTECVLESGLQQEGGGTVSMKQCCTLEAKRNTNREAAEFTFEGQLLVRNFDRRLNILVIVQGKCQTFAGSSFLNVRIGCFSLSFMSVNEESLAF